MQKQNKREIKYEIIRVIAMMFVIIIHQLDQVRWKLNGQTGYNLIALIFLLKHSL